MDLTRAASVREMACATLAESPQHFAMAGLSLGGIVAFEIVRLAPERITRLALLDTTPYPMQPERAQPWKPLLEIADEQEFTALASHQLASMMHPKHRDDPRLVEAVQKMVKHNGQTGLKNQLCAQIQRPDSRPTLRHIQVPTTVIVGREDTACPVEFHREMASQIPSASLFIVDECGHLSSLERPDVVTSILRMWLSQIL